MTNQSAPKVLRILLWSIPILLTGAAIFALIRTVNRSIERVVAPLEQTNRLLGTQVADLLHPTPTILPDPVTIIYEIRAIARLETIQYSVEKVITAEQNQGIFKSLIGDRLLFVAHGEVIAGIDMGKIQVEDLWLEDGILHVRLPAPEILVSRLDNELSYVYDRNTGFLTHGNIDLETEARQAAEQEIRTAALEDGILEQARINARVFLEKFFQALGYSPVVFVGN
jgi:hypothetical protein